MLKHKLALMAGKGRGKAGAELADRTKVEKCNRSGVREHTVCLTDCQSHYRRFVREDGIGNSQNPFDV